MPASRNGGGVMIEFHMKTFLADQRKKEKYVCDRIPEDGMRIVLYEGSPGESSIIADLSVECWEGNVDLVIETNEPDVVDLNEVYRYFRRREMTVEEFWREMNFVDPEKDYRRKIALLSQTERELFEESSEHERRAAQTIADRAGHDLSGQTKGCLSVLVKLGLLDKHRGYLRRQPPRHPYHG
jgi:hypothetical protein